MVGDRRLNRVECGEHPFHRPRPCAGIARKQAAKSLGNMKDNRAGFEQRQIALLKGRHLSEWLACAVGRCFLRAL